MQRCNGWVRRQDQKGQRPTQKRSLLSPLEAGGRLGRDRVHAGPNAGTGIWSGQRLAFSTAS